MDKGDKLKVIELVPHTREGMRKIETIGIIQQVDKFTITIKRLVNGELTNNTSYNVADCNDPNKSFYIFEDGKWKRIKIKTTNADKNNDFKRWKGGKYA
jgi:hypothetical protein